MMVLMILDQIPYCINPAEVNAVTEACTKHYAVDIQRSKHKTQYANTTMGQERVSRCSTKALNIEDSHVPCHTAPRQW